MRKILLVLIPIFILLSCNYSGNHDHPNEFLLGTNYEHEENVENIETDHYHPPHDFLHNHLDYDIEVFIEESNGVVRPGLYNREKGEPQVILEANSNKAFSDIRLKENIKLVLRLPKLAESEKDNFSGVKFRSDGLDVNSTTIRQFENGEFVMEMFINEVDEHVGYLKHVTGHVCDPADPNCE